MSASPPTHTVKAFASVANLLFAARSLAQVAGHAAEIARLVQFAGTGQWPPVGGRTESRTYAHG